MSPSEASSPKPSSTGLHLNQYQAIALDALAAECDDMVAELQANQARIASILDITHEAIISIDAEQNIILFNKGAEKIFGYTAEEVLGRPLDILLPPNSGKTHRDHVVDFAQAAEHARLMGQRRQIAGRRKNGQVFPAEASISKLTTPEAIFTVVLRDITNRQQAEKEREHLIIQLRALNEATQVITAELSLEQVLQKITGVAQNLMAVKHAALSVHTGEMYFSRVVTSGINPTVYKDIEALPTGRGSLGALLAQGESIIINHIPRHPLADGFPNYHRTLHNLLGVPLFSKNALLGALYLADKQDGADFTPNDQQLAERLALHAAIAIENATLHEQAQRLVVLEERERFAHDLHDGIIQSIYAVGLVLQQAKADILPENELTREQIDVSLKNLATVVQDLRNYIFDLRPQAVKRDGLKIRLNTLLAEIKANMLLPIEAHIEDAACTCLSDWQSNHIFHICHEALSNAVRHAKPAQVKVSLLEVNGVIEIEVADDGRGFDVPVEILPGHRGLSNIRARATKLGAKFNINSAPGQGTTIHLTLEPPAA